MEKSRAILHGFEGEKQSSDDDFGVFFLESEADFAF